MRPKRDHFFPIWLVEECKEQSKLGGLVTTGCSRVRLRREHFNKNSVVAQKQWAFLRLKAIEPYSVTVRFTLFLSRCSLHFCLSHLSFHSVPFPWVLSLCSFHNVPFTLLLSLYSLCFFHSEHFILFLSL